MITPTINPTVLPTLRPCVGFGGFRGVLDKYPLASAALSLRALSSSWLAGDVVEVRRDNGDTSDFTAGQIDSGAMLSFVNHGTTDLYDSARYFNGVDAYVAIPTITISGDFDVSATHTPSGGTNERILGNSSTAEWMFNIVSTSQLSFRAQGASGKFVDLDSALIAGDNTTFRAVRTSGVTSVYINGILQSNTITGSEDYRINRIGSQAANFTKGIIYDININNQAAYTGQGTSVTAWQDTIGSNDGTETNGAAYTGQPFNGYVSSEYDQSGVVVRDATQDITTSQVKIVDSGSVVLDGNGNVSTLWDGVDDDFDVVAGFAGLTAANVYAVTDNGGVVTINTLTAQDISSATKLSTVLSSLTYDKVTAVIIYPDATDQAGIEAELTELYA